jgi:ribosomal protein S18 acetylase RimI-like enzyme
MRVDSATPADMDALLPLMRGYCDFYEVAPPDEGLRKMARALIEADDSEGMLLVARSDSGEAIGFAAVGWKWSSLRASRVAIMEDLFVDPEARGSGAGRALIDECAARAQANGAPALLWVTALDNQAAQSVYDRTSAKSERWLEYELDLG